MKHPKNLSKINRVKIAACACLGAAVATTLLTTAVSFTTNSLAAMAFGICIGVLAWLGYERSGPQNDASVQDSSSPFQGSPAHAKTFALTSVVSAFFVSFGWVPSLKLMGAAGCTACLGFMLAAKLLNRK